MCHPLQDTSDINARLDAVDALNTNNKTRDLFANRFAKLADLERLISRVHAGKCTVKQFVTVLEGFGVIFDAVRDMQALLFEDTTLLGQIIRDVPNLVDTLEKLNNSFDTAHAREKGKIS